jgi:hypothetical protein
MTQGVKHIGVVADESAPPAAVETVPPRPSTTRQNTIFAAIGVVLGAAVAFGFDVLKDHVDSRLPLPDHPPSVAVSRLYISTPEVLVPNVATPVPPIEVIRRMDDLRDNLLLTNTNVVVKLGEATAISKLVQRSHSLGVIDTPLGHIDVDAWRDNIGTATATIASSYSRRPILQKLFDEVIAAKALTDADKTAKFESIVSDFPDISEAFRDAAVFYSAQPADVTKPIEDRINAATSLTQRGERAARWHVENVESGSAIYIPGRPIFLQNKGALDRHYLGRFALAMSVLPYEDLAALFRVSMEGFQTEINTLTEFLTKSHELLATRLNPRIRVESVVVNQSKAPLTVTPYGAARIGVANVGDGYTIPLRITAVGGKAAAGTDSPETLYVTLAPRRCCASRMDRNDRRQPGPTRRMAAHPQRLRQWHPRCKCRR